jgi:hypothetical protein
MVVSDHSHALASLLLVPLTRKVVGPRRRFGWFGNEINLLSFRESKYVSSDVQAVVQSRYCVVDGKMRMLLSSSGCYIEDDWDYVVRRRWFWLNARLYPEWLWCLNDPPPFFCFFPKQGSDGNTKLITNCCRKCTHLFVLIHIPWNHKILLL